jgi:hypothetical protein
MLVFWQRATRAERIRQFALRLNNRQVRSASWFIERFRHEEWVP